MADEQQLPAYPIRAYQLIPDPNQPTVVALAIETDQGHSLFLATRQILEDLGNDLLARAAKMPVRPSSVKNSQVVDFESGNGALGQSNLPEKGCAEGDSLQT
jgi:hypothetical protein